MPKKLEGYQVKFLVKLTGVLAPYTSAKRPLDLEMAHAYRSHLERSLTSGQIIDLSTGKIVEEWKV